MDNNSQFAILSPGEIDAGMFVTIFETYGPQQKAGGFSLFHQPAEQPEDDEPKIVRYNNPWLKGIPFKVLQVALPLIMVENLVKYHVDQAIAPALFFDTRFLSFLEVREEYAKAYIESHNKAMSHGRELNAQAPVYVGKPFFFSPANPNET